MNVIYGVLDMWKRAVSCFLVLVIGICCLCPLSAGAYSSVSFMLRSGSPFNITSDFDGIMLLNYYFSSSSDSTVLNSPDKFCDLSFTDGIWNGSEISSLSSPSLLNQSNVGYSVTSAYDSASSRFIYCLTFSVPVSAGDSFNLSVSSSSFASLYSSYCYIYSLPGVSCVRRVFSSGSDAAYTLKSSNQHLVFFHDPSRSNYIYSSQNISDLTRTISSSFGLDLVKNGYTGCYAVYSTPYGAASGSDISLDVLVETFCFSVYECLTDVQQSGGSMDYTDDSGSGSGGSGFDDSNIISAIKNIPAKIGEFFTSALDSAVNSIRSFLEDLFMPDPEIITKEVELLHSKFIWYESVKDLVNDVVENITALDGKEPGQIYLNIPSNNTLTLGGLGSSKPLVIDLSWFSKYRSTVHTVFSAFLWIMYIWRLLHTLPNIINGVGGAVGAPYVANTAMANAEASAERKEAALAREENTLMNAQKMDDFYYVKDQLANDNNDARDILSGLSKPFEER